LAAPPPKGELRGELQKLAEREWRHPATGEPVSFGVSTLERWYYRALKERHDPVGVLRRKVRKDAGWQASMSAAVRQALLSSGCFSVSCALSAVVLLHRPSNQQFVEVLENQIQGRDRSARNTPSSHVRSDCAGGDILQGLDPCDFGSSTDA
jgi:hypothetical protein